MTTQTYTSVVDHSSDAGFRAWGSQLGVNLALAGLVQTADTGQINWVTVLRPGVNTVGGYEIWRFADSSLYLKLEYGTANAATTTQMYVTVGTGSNGSGTITGQTNTRSTFTQNTVAVSAVTAYTTYISRTADALSIVWKMNAIASNAPLALLVVGKTVDSSGAATTTGFCVLRYGTSSNLTLQSVRTATTAATYNDNTTFNCIPGAPSVSSVGADIQAYLCWMNVPQVLPVAWFCAYIVAEVTKLNTFSTALVSTPTHTYLALGGLTGSLNGQPTSTYSLAVIYE